jgi:hypothetical protein
MGYYMMRVVTINLFHKMKREIGYVVGRMMWLVMVLY